MRVGVIRGDVPGPVFLADLEPTSQANFPTEPEGQSRYISRPTADSVEAMMAASIPASIVSTGAIAFPLAIINANHTLKIKGPVGDAYTSVVVANDTYANIDALVAAVNTVLAATNFAAVAFSATKLALQTKTKGTGTRILIDTAAGGSTFNTPAVLGAGGQVKTVPAPAGFITTTLPVGGPLDVSASTIRTSLGGGLTDAQVKAAADAIAPQFIETDTLIKSVLVGDLHGLLSASWNPDPNRIPVIDSGAAIAVVEDDGSTLFAVTGPTILNAEFNVPGAGDVTITGTGLASAGAPNAEVEATKVKFYADKPESVQQYYIVDANGTVTSTSIVILAALVPAGVAVGTQVQVQYTSLVSTKFALV